MKTAERQQRDSGETAERQHRNIDKETAQGQHRDTDKETAQSSSETHYSPLGKSTKSSSQTEQ